MIDTPISERQASKLSESQVESAGDSQLLRRAILYDSRYSVIPQATWTAHRDQIAGLQDNGLERLFASRPADHELCRVAKRDRHNRNSRRECLGSLILVLVQAQFSGLRVLIEDANIRRYVHLN